MDIEKELTEKLEEIKLLKQEIKEKIRQLIDTRNNIQDMVKDFLSIEVPETQKYTIKRIKIMEIQIGNLGKIDDNLKKYYELLKDLTEKEIKVLTEMKKDRITQSEKELTQQQFWLLLSKLEQKENF